MEFRRANDFEKGVIIALLDIARAIREASGLSTVAEARFEHMKEELTGDPYERLREERE